MDRRTIQLLEFEKILELLMEDCISEEGRMVLSLQEFITQTKELASLHDLVGEVKRYLESPVPLPYLNFGYISAIVKKGAKEGSALEGDELYLVADYIISAGKLKKYFLSGDVTGAERIKALVSEFPDVNDVASQITAVLEPTGRVKENHPAIRKLKNELKNIRSSISKAAASYLNDNKDIWQTDTPAERDGRIVLPLKSDYKGRVKGIVHHMSARGATLYIEPFELLELNNKATIIENDIVVQVRKILKGLTETVSAQKEEIISLIGNVSYLDTLMARARYSVKNRCYRARISTRVTALNKARHPLLGEKAVPINISIDGDLKILIITGPNAGGKTVTLKTVGLLALMNQFGMEIPAEEGSSLPVFENVFADIGDDQSLENALSTFSGHMNTISRIIKSSQGRTLVLLDELGSGTDPAEGVSIAMAVLDSFLDLDSVVLTTSHHGLLKNYGFTKPHVENASMEFDRENHSPTYRVIQGIPGESHAIEIARLSGLDPSIVEKAEGYMRSEQSDISTMIKELERKQNKLLEREKRLKEDIKRYDLAVLSLKQKENMARKDGFSSLNKFLNESRRNLENLVKELKEGELTREKTLKVKRFAAEIEDRLEVEKEKISAARAEAGINSDLDLKEGMNVLVGNHKRKGLLLRKGRDDSWVVQVGAVRMSFPVSEITPSGESEKPDKRHSVAVSGVFSDNQPSFTLDIRGMRAEEASLKVTKQLDNAIMKGMREFEIIHGKGEGTLQKVVYDILSESGNIESYNFAKPEAGGFGKTIVRLKE